VSLDLNDGGHCQCVDAFENYFVLSYTALRTQNCAVNMRSVDLDSWEVSFNSESFLHLDGSDLSTLITQHAALAASHCKLENHLVSYFNLL